MGDYDYILRERKQKAEQDRLRKIGDVLGVGSEAVFLKAYKVGLDDGLVHSEALIAWSLLAGGPGFETQHRDEGFLVFEGDELRYYMHLGGKTQPYYLVWVAPLGQVEKVALHVGHLFVHWKALPQRDVFVFPGFANNKEVIIEAIQAIGDKIVALR